MSYSLNTRGCVPVHAHYSNLPNCVCLQGQPLCQMSLNVKMEIAISIYLFLMLGINFLWNYQILGPSRWRM